ncbi:MAG TPA: hypothetical protein VM618_09510 [Acidimicrobiia bacterium]|nr:hypothetical protein [Acidimicrobiia bacterium]
MRRKFSAVTTLVLTTAVVLGAAAPAVAQEAGGGAKPWHYWVAPVLLVGGILVLAAIGVGYYFRVIGGRGRR